MAEGLRFIWRKAGLKELVLLSATSVFFTAPIIILLPFYVEDWLRTTADWYGFLSAAYGVGALGGFLLAGAVRFQGRARGTWTVGCIILQAAGGGLLGLIRSPMAALVLAFAGGAAGGFVRVNITTILQIVTPSQMRGRVFGLLGTLSGILYPIASGLSGIVADLVDQNIPLLYVGSGTILTVLTLAVSLRKDLRLFFAQSDTSHQGVENMADDSDLNTYQASCKEVSHKEGVC
jgi:MFS family permease